MRWIHNYFSSLLFPGYRENFIGVWHQCRMNIVSCSGLEGCWLCRGTLFFVWVGCEAGVLKIAFPYPSVRLTNKQVILVTQPHKLVKTYILFVLLGWSIFILLLYWEIVRDMRGNQIITTVSWRNWEQRKFFNQNNQPPADIWTRYLPNVNQTHTPYAMRELMYLLHCWWRIFEVFLDIMPCKLVKWCKRMQFIMLTDKLFAWSSCEQKEFTFCLTNSTYLLRFLFGMLPYCYLSVWYKNCVLMWH
jgi:hypothetical protein